MLLVAAPVNKEVPFKIVTAAAGPNKPKVTVASPKGAVVESPIEQTPEGFTSKFTPLEAGPHAVNVTLGDKPIPGSPFNVDALDVSKVQVQELPQSEQIISFEYFTQWFVHLTTVASVQMFMRVISIDWRQM